jgi:hypothetical protein
MATVQVLVKISAVDDNKPLLLFFGPVGTPPIALQPLRLFVH